LAKATCSIAAETIDELELAPEPMLGMGTLSSAVAGHI